MNSASGDDKERYDDYLSNEQQLPDLTLEPFPDFFAMSESRETTKEPHDSLLLDPEEARVSKQDKREDKASDRYSETPHHLIINLEDAALKKAAIGLISMGASLSGSSVTIRVIDRPSVSPTSIDASLFEAIVQSNALKESLTLRTDHLPQLIGPASKVVDDVKKPYYELLEDLGKGDACALLAVILCLLAHHCRIVHLDLSHCILHDLSLLDSFFDHPRLCTKDPANGKRSWIRPIHWAAEQPPEEQAKMPYPTLWRKTYPGIILRRITREVEHFELPATWSWGPRPGGPSIAPYHSMAPISTFPGFRVLKRLVMPYHAIVKHRKTRVPSLPACAFPATLEVIIVLDAYPSRFLLKWVKDMKAEKIEWRPLEGQGRLMLKRIEICFQHFFSEWHYGRLIEGASVNGRLPDMVYEPPGLIMKLED